MLTSKTPCPRLAPRSGHLYALLAICILSLAQATAWAQEHLASGGLLDPPARIARLNLLEGAVGFAPANAADAAARSAWTPATLNRPLTTGDRLWSGQRARTELHIGSSAVRMNEQTGLDFLALDDHLTQLRLNQGSVQLRVRTLLEGQRLEIDTPNLAFVISEPGNYRVDANPASDTTRVVALSGAGLIYGDGGLPLRLSPQQQVSLTGTRLTPAAPGASVQDGFDAWALARDQREDQSISARYVPRETVGYQQLDAYGDWSQDPSYGAVWLPRAVPVNWAPYRAGHWSWIAPWGWTWIDDAPWGFAPFHYGRWAQIGPRWAWVPGRLAANPVYAPALVAFIGSSSGGGLSRNLSIGYGGASQPSVGWFPLAPGEAYQPAYQASPRYLTQINSSIAVNNIVNMTQVYRYRYQHQPAAVTAVRSADFVRGQPVGSHQQLLSARELGRAQWVNGNATNHRVQPQVPDWQTLRQPPTASAAATAAAARVRVDAAQSEPPRAFRRDLAHPGARSAAAPTRSSVAATAPPDPRAATSGDSVGPMRRAGQQRPSAQQDQQHQSAKPQRPPQTDEPRQQQTRQADSAPAIASRADGTVNRNRDQQKPAGRRKAN